MSAAPSAYYTALQRLARRYHIIAINERTQERTRMTAYPLTHAEACTNLSKLTVHKARRLMLDEVTA